jgi:hypothetical protein
MGRVKQLLDDASSPFVGDIVDNGERCSWTGFPESW